MRRTDVSTDDVFCRTTVNYSTGDPNGELAPVEVVVRDGRVADLPGWEECGFQLVWHRSTLDDWSDDEAIADVHYAELESLARELTGCDHTTITSHIKRGPEYAALHEDLAPSSSSIPTSPWDTTTSCAR